MPMRTSCPGGEQRPVAGDALEDLSAAVYELDAGPCDEVPHCRGGEYLASLREGADTGADVYRQAREVVTADFAFADVDSGADLYPKRTRAVGDCLRAANSAGRTVEGREHAIAGRVDLPAVELFELNADHRVVAVEEGAPVLIANFSE